MDLRGILAAYDEQMRRTPPGGRVEVVAPVVRVIDEDAGWAGVVWSDLHAANADAVIAREIAHFADVPLPWEWKYHSYDQPPDLPDRLRAAGLRGGEPETVMVAELADLATNTPAPAGVVVREVAGAADVDAYTAVQTQVFGGDHSAFGRYLARRPPGTVAFVAWAGERPVCAGRVDLPLGREFAGIWSGGTVPEWRRRGIFRALVAARARIAASRGYRYLQVDASPDSRPILRQLGFVEIATTIPFVSKITATP